MSTDNAILERRPAEFRRRVVVQPFTPRRVINSEWIKFSTLRSSWITLFASLLGTVAVGVLACGAIASHWSRLSPGDIASFSAVTQSLEGVVLAQLAIGVLGVLVITGEYATGMIRATLGAVPTRLPVLWAKLGVFGAISFVVSLVGAGIAFFSGQALLGVHGVAISAPDAVRAIIGAALYLTVVGFIAMGIGFMLRSTAGAIASVFGLLLVVPAIGHVLPSNWQHDLLPYLPSNAGAALWDLHPGSDSLSPWTGFGVMCLWALATIVGAAVALTRRDA